MENYSLSDVYSSLRLQNMETMMEIVCHEVDCLKVHRGIGPIPNPFTLWPLILSVVVKLTLLIVVFFMVTCESFYMPEYPVSSVVVSLAEDEKSSEKSTTE